MAHEKLYCSLPLDPKKLHGNVTFIHLVTASSAKQALVCATALACTPLTHDACNGSTVKQVKGQPAHVYTGACSYVAPMLPYRQHHNRHISKLSTILSASHQCMYVLCVCTHVAQTSLDWFVDMAVPHVYSTPALLSALMGTINSYQSLPSSAIHTINIHAGTKLTPNQLPILLCRPGTLSMAGCAMCTLCAHDTAHRSSYKILGPARQGTSQVQVEYLVCK